jgi:signal peptidase I
MSAELRIISPVSTAPGQVIALDRKSIRSTRSWWRGLGQTALIGLLAFGSYFLISHFFVESVTVVGVSMVPTLQNSQRYLLNRWVYYVHPPHRSDVVVLRDPSDNGFSVKRIVGVAGDTIHLKEGRVFVNGQELKEPYLSPGTPTFPNRGLFEASFKCGTGQFFVLGDNRNNSVDSRTYGPVPRRNILGLVIR